MKNLIKVILLILIPISGVFILSYPGVWKYRIENVLNREILKDSGWDLSIGELSGHLFKQIYCKNIEITHENGTKFHIPNINAQFNVLQSLAGNLHLKELNIFDFYFHQSSQKNTENNVLILPDLDYSKFPLIVDNLTFDGSLAVALADTTHLISLNIQSAIQPDETGLIIKLDSLFTKHNDIEYSFILSDTKIKINNRIINVTHISGSLADLQLDGELTFLQTEKQQLKGNININNITVPEDLFKETPLQVKFSNINSNLRFDTDFNNYSGLLTVNNNLGLNMTGDFNISKFRDRWLAQQILLQSEDARLFIHGDFIDSKEITAIFNLKQLDLSEWLTQQQSTDISGHASLNAIINAGAIQSLTVDLKTKESALFENDTLFINGKFVYENDILNIADPFTISVGSSSITTLGQIDFSEEEIDLEIDLQDANISIINKIWNDSLKNGTISGNVIATGKFDDPVIVGSLKGNDIKYKDFILSEIEVVGQRNVSDDILGSAELQLGKGQWKNIVFEYGNLDAVFKQKEMYISNVEIVNGNDYLNCSVMIDNFNTIHLENVKAFFRNHYLVNINPFSIKYNKDIFSISPFIVHLDDGVIEGEINYDRLLKGNLKFSNIESKILHPFINNHRYKFTGLMFGNMNFDDSSGDQNYLIDISVKNGTFSTEPFEQLRASMDYRNEILNISELVLKNNDKSWVDIKGIIPFKEASKTKKIQLQSEYHNTNYKVIAQFLPDWFDINGIVNGELNIEGTRKNMKSDFNAIISNASFDKISLGTVQGRGNYDGLNLNFNSFSSDLDNDHFTGFGNLPIDLNISSDAFGRFRGKDSLFVFVEGKSSNLDFISNYFDEVNKAPGSYRIALKLSGIWDKIIRNGNISAKDVTIFTPLLDDPIEQMHGQVNIINNQLIINNLKGKMYKSNKQKSSKDDNVFLSGRMDMTNFFDPYIEINATGENIFFRSLIYEMEGNTDFNVDITGKDTIKFSGEVAPIDVEMFQPLTMGELGVLPSEEGSTIIHYKINFPIKGKFKLTNDQLDAVMIGDVSINQFGDREMDFAGELILDSGKFYYYGDIFTISEGYLTFDNHGFNPFLDISANTVIDGERIDVTIVGLIDNPLLTFTSESGFSQSDILELLTWRKRFEEQDISSTGLGYQASDIVLSWFGSQLDKNILEVSGLNKLGILENIDVHGTTGLLTAGKDFSISAPLTDNVLVNYAYRRSFGIRDSYHSLGVELRLNRNLSLVGNIDRSGYMHVKYRIRYKY